MRSPVSRSTAVTAAFLMLYTLVMFRVVWPSGQTIQSGDYNYGLMAYYKAEMPEAMVTGFWRSAPLLGRTGFMPPTWNHLVLTLLPVEVFTDWIYGLNLLLASGFLIGFLRLKGLSRPAAALGALTAFWLGSNLTLVHPGHLDKYGVLLFASACLYCLERTLMTPSARWSLLAGAALGMMFMHQADLALFFGLLLGPYFAWGLVRNRGDGVKPLTRRALPLLLPFLLLTWETYQLSMREHIASAEILQEGSEEEKWNFATQWSWPPAESIDLIAPGFMGWMSNHPEAPYTGVMGRSTEWESTGRGFVNFKLESQYIGVIPLALCMAALAVLFHRGNAARGDILFWTLAAALAYLLAAGKFFPLYRWFYQLPLVGSIRNPNKFLQVFQLALGVLAAYGADHLFRDAGPRSRRTVAGLFLAVALAAGLGWIMTDPSDALQLQTFADSPWAGHGEDILRTRRAAWGHLAVFSLIGGSATLAGFRARLRTPALAGLVLLVAVDGWMLGREYLKSSDIRFLKDNELAEFLKRDLEPQRVAVLDTSGLYGYYITHLFPAHHIPFANISAAPRLHSDYRRYFEAVGRDQLRYWREFGVKYVLMPRGMWDRVRNAPGIGEALKEVYAYEVVGLPDGGMRVAPRPVGRGGSQVVLELLSPSDRFMLVNAWREGSSREALEAVSAGAPPFQTARIQSEVEPVQYEGRPGTVSGAVDLRDGFLVNVEVDHPRSLLRLSDRYDPDLRARVNDGEPQPLLRVDHLFAGLILEQGAHRIEFGFSEPVAPRAAQWGGLLLTGIILLSLLLPGRRSTP